MYGSGKPVTFSDVVDLIDADVTPERDINIGRNNAIAIRKDIKGKGMGAVYWTPQQPNQEMYHQTTHQTLLLHWVMEHFKDIQIR